MSKNNKITEQLEPIVSKNITYERALVAQLYERLKEPRSTIQVVAGPRQVGKTTAMTQLEAKDGLGLVRSYSADDILNSSSIWIDQIWESLRVEKELRGEKSAILIIDEIQKISNWSEAVKKNWDKDTKLKTDIRLVILGSSRLLMQKGLSESLMGRFELSYVGHWVFEEMNKVFGLTPEQYAWFGGYPGAARYIGDERRFVDYVKNSIINPTVERDILGITAVREPTLLRRVFDLGVAYNTRELSYNKMLGQLQDVGNTTTLSRYLELLGEAGLVGGLEKYSNKTVVKKASSPKFCAQNMALVSASSKLTYREARIDSATWGQVIEGVVGVHLANAVASEPRTELFYWRDGNNEVDFVLACGRKIIGLEVKSNAKRNNPKAAEAFIRRFPNAKVLLVGESGIAWQQFIKYDVGRIFDSLAE
jgi:predicted AAA+ superfamily ATPase